MQLVGSTPPSTGSTENNNEYANVDDNSGNDNGNTNVSENGSVEISGQTVVSTLTCSKSIPENELSLIEGASSGTVAMTAGFDSNTELVNVKLVKSVVYDSDETATPEQIDTKSANVADLDSETAKLFDLPVSDNGNLLSLLENVQMNYEALDYTCKLL